MPDRNSKRDAERVVDHFGYDTILRVAAAIRDTRSHHPPDASCECEAMEALGVLIRDQFAREGGEG